MLIGLYARERRLLWALIAVAIFYAAAPGWANGWLPVLSTASGDNAYIRAVIILIMATSLAFVVSMSRSLGEVETLRGRRIRALRLAHAALAVAACLVAIPILSVLVDRPWAVLAGCNALGLLGLGAATAALTRSIPAWLPVLVAVLLTWMLGMQVPEDVAQPWAWLMIPPPAQTGIAVDVAVAIGGLSLWVLVGPRGVVGEED